MNPMRVLAAMLAALSLSCTSVPRTAAVPPSCGLPAGEGWAPLAQPPQGAADALEAMHADNPFRDPPDSDSRSLWLGNKRLRQVAYCDYSGRADCGVGTAMVFRRTDGAWKPDDDAFVTMYCDQR